jgi:hypothetical protein
VVVPEWIGAAAAGLPGNSAGLNNVYTRPWKIAMPLYRRMEPNMQLLEFRCNEFVEEFMYGNLRKVPLVKHWESETMTIDITRKVPPGDAFYQWYGR